MRPRRRRPFGPRRRPFGPRRRRGFFGFPPGPRVPLGAGPRRKLEQAHRLMAAGEFEQAAAMFARLASVAEEHGMLQRAAQLNLQTGRALLELKNGDAAASHARKALGLFLQAGMPGRAVQLLPRIVGELRTRGFTAEADALQAEANTRLADQELSLNAPVAPRPPAGRGTLPATCPQCGGPLRPDEVEWLDENTAECLFCGSVIQAE